MCYAPQRCALFEHLNFQKCSERAAFCTFWLGNVLRATTACDFSTPQLPKVLRTWFALRILTSKCASRHSGVQFFISHLPRRLRTRRFSEPTFRPSGGPKQRKNTRFRVSSTFPHTLIFFLLPSSSLIFSLLPVSSLALPASALSSVHIVGSLTSKLPLTNRTRIRFTRTSQCTILH